MRHASNFSNHHRSNSLVVIGVRNGDSRVVGFDPPSGDRTRQNTTESATRGRQRNRRFFENSAKNATFSETLAGALSVLFQKHDRIRQSVMMGYHPQP